MKTKPRLFTSQVSIWSKIFYILTICIDFIAIGGLVYLSIVNKTTALIASIIFLTIVVLITTKIFSDTCKQIELNKESLGNLNKR